MIKAFWELVKAIGRGVRGSGGKATPPTPPRPTPPRCTTNCARLARTAVKPNRRHDPCKTKSNDVTKPENFMFDPSVNVADDIAQMNAGNFVRAGENIIVNGRTYGWHPDTGVTFPKSGPGIVPFNRLEHGFIKNLNSNGLEAAMNEARRTPGMTQEMMDKVLDLWGKCK